MKIYTRKGDQGETQLIGKRVKKTNDRVEAYGTIDELNCFVGVGISILDGTKHTDLLADLTKIQHELFDIGGDLANVKENKDIVTDEEIVPYLENRIDAYWDEAPPLKTFILPGGNALSANLHVCRAITRRAERNVLIINDDIPIPQVIIKYLNRLSDFFFAAARAVNARENIKDIPYERGRDVFK
ncbi:cob(I)yrinic acid a,c-diamide adenosyltransferase [Evansella cellulosilytica]|uniref:Corrinoid adenosyltransferase n=1 Tax=Evansella cellulosilytica (strain ATCC 21833 / DSM 2522 / FERM P-1141 / JCM 9156 / N-4) TaxID=649639 RepID=E6TYN8_EVAC2|nr:cob(I)yrinic acid a,c-diamide adenosyltransferase [Evansella cellulosilytica]ADU30088.1 ATP/cobalamin adenosyltransferase [Evansella cellulosilytica DSM 2522]